jgi:hypothetical protein
MQIESYLHPDLKLHNLPGIHLAENGLSMVGEWLENGWRADAAEDQC